MQSRKPRGNCKFWPPSVEVSSHFDIDVCDVMRIWPAKCPKPTEFMHRHPKTQGKRRFMKPKCETFRAFRRQRVKNTWKNGHVRRQLARHCPCFGLSVSKTQEKQCHQVWMCATVITFCIPHVKNAGKTAFQSEKCETVALFSAPLQASTAYRGRRKPKNGKFQRLQNRMKTR